MTVSTKRKNISKSKSKTISKSRKSRNKTRKIRGGGTKIRPSIQRNTFIPPAIMRAQAPNPTNPPGLASKKVAWVPPEIQQHENPQLQQTIWGSRRSSPPLTSIVTIKPLSPPGARAQQGAH